MFSFLIHAAFEIKISANSPRHIEQPKDNKVVDIHDSINKKYGSYRKYSKYGVFTTGARMFGIIRKLIRWNVQQTFLLLYVICIQPTVASVAISTGLPRRAASATFERR
jgi:hypothetical protein